MDAGFPARRAILRPTMERMSTETQMRPLLTVFEVAERLNLSESTVRRRIEVGEIPALRLGAGPQSPVRVDPAALEAWLDQRLASAPKPVRQDGETLASSPRGGLEGEA